MVLACRRASERARLSISWRTIPLTPTPSTAIGSRLTTAYTKKRRAPAVARRGLVSVADEATSAYRPAPLGCEVRHVERERARRGPCPLALACAPWLGNGS